MSWGVAARLPSPMVDMVAIERAARAVADAEGRHMRVEVDGPEVHFIIDGPEVRPWEEALGFLRDEELDAEWQRRGYDGLSDVPLTVRRQEYPIDKYNDEVYAELIWDTAWSGNAFCPMIGQHLFEQLATRLGAVVQAA